MLNVLRNKQSHLCYIMCSDGCIIYKIYISKPSHSYIKIFYTKLQNWHDIKYCSLKCIQKPYKKILSTKNKSYHKMTYTKYIEYILFAI